MTEREQEILAILRNEPLIAQQDLADRLGISRSAAAGHIMGLMRKGHVLGKGYVLADAQFVLAIGGANMDIVADTHLPLVHGDSTPGRITTSPGGVARNVAENLARLGTDIRLVSAVGDDFYGRRLLELTHAAGVDVQACSVWPKHTTSTYLSLHGPDGDMWAAINDMAILEDLTPEVLNAHAGQVRNAYAVVVDCNLSTAALGWVFAHSGGKPVFVEAVSAHKCVRVLPWLNRIHTLKANRIEAAALTGLDVQSVEQAQSAARALCDLGVQHVVVSLGDHGVCWCRRVDGAKAQRYEEGRELPLQVEVVNASGAGDALMAGLVHGLLQGASMVDAIHFANGCAGMTVSCASANHPGLCEASVRHLLLGTGA